MESKEETKSRSNVICPACGGEKAVGLVVCWKCFKYCENGLKFTPLPFMEWLETFDSVPDAATRQVRDNLTERSKSCRL